jgi:hypothetical protein
LIDFGLSAIGQVLFSFDKPEHGNLHIPILGRRWKYSSHQARFALLPTYFQVLQKTWEGQTEWVR